MIQELKTSPAMFFERSNGLLEPEFQRRYLDKDELTAFVKCDSDEDVIRLAKRYHPLFGAHRDSSETYSANDYRDFCYILSDALNIKASVDGNDAIDLDGLHGMLKRDEGAFTYLYALLDNEAYADMLTQGCRNFCFLDHAPSIHHVHDEEYDGNLLIIQADTLKSVFVLLQSLHLVDVVKFGTMDIALSLASSIWSTLTESLRNGRVQICSYEKCGRPFIVSGERGMKREYCCDSHKQMQWRLNKARKANSAQ